MNAMDSSMLEAYDFFVFYDSVDRSFTSEDMAFTNVLLIFILKGISNLLSISAFHLGFINGLMSESVILWFGIMLIWEAKQAKE